MGNKGKIGPEEPPSSLVPLLQITYAWKLEILVTAVFLFSLKHLQINKYSRGSYGSQGVFCYNGAGIFSIITPCW